MELYRKIEELRDDRTVEVAVSYLEVYNESIIDLINPESGQLAIRDDGKSANIAGNFNQLVDSQNTNVNERIKTTLI